MSIDLANFEELTKSAVAHFWQSRQRAQQRQTESGKLDQGQRSAVTAGNHMDGFIALIKAIVVANGLSEQDISVTKGFLTLPGFYRSTKMWDILIVHKQQLVAALELKSQVGSFGNNFNNRCEEAIGSATDLWTAFREGAFGDSPRPFVGYLMLLQDSPEVHSPIRETSAHFAILPEFRNSSYAQRYELLCKKLILERLYDAATLLLSPADKGLQGAYSELGQVIGLRRWATALASHVAAVATE